jgi:hypothetical protein
VKCSILYLTKKSLLLNFSLINVGHPLYVGSRSGRGSSNVGAGTSVVGSHHHALDRPTFRYHLIKLIVRNLKYNQFQISLLQLMIEFALIWFVHVEVIYGKYLNFEVLLHHKSDDLNDYDCLTLITFDNCATEVPKMTNHFFAFSVHTGRRRQPPPSATRVLRRTRRPTGATSWLTRSRW